MKARMRRILPFLAVCLLCIGVSDAALRTTNVNSRNSGIIYQNQTSQRQNSTAISSRNTATSSRTVTQRATTNTGRTTTSRSTTQARNTSGASRSTINNQQHTSTARSAAKSANLSRAATTSKTFGSGYNSCRDAYFTCMDQFCATADDSYRRCICSSRLNEIKTKQRALGDAADQLQTFKDLNIDVIPKTAAEVNAMLTASSGESYASKARDNSASAQKLAGISSVLSRTKSNALSTSGTLDIAGNINDIWATTDLANGVNIANLTGEMLYNAVHSQCADLVADHCESKSTLNMVITAYGMYIENDCTILSNALDKKKNATNATIREAEREMNAARLDNYNAHNATSINDCVAKVRRDITNDAACGTDYIHCLDVSGQYLNRITGEPIYSASFYQLETMLSLSGDILTNQTNRLLVSELNSKRNAAANSLSTCQDLADDVWDEFMRQAITEIYQGQQSRIRQVKDECLNIVNQCYDKQTASLRDFSNTKEQLLLGTQLELSEQLCRDKLDACSNLYGGGPDGMAELIATMQNITSQKIAQNCLATLQEYVTTLCSVPPSDTVHSYPYACRVYAPGEQKYAMTWKCQGYTYKNTTSTETGDNTDEPTPSTGSCPGITEPTTIDVAHNYYYCAAKNRRYISCKDGYYLSNCHTQYTANNCNWPTHSRRWSINKDSILNGAANWCQKCPPTVGDNILLNCPGDKICPYINDPDDPNSGNNEPTPSEQPEEDQSECSDYVGSLYQKVVRYAMQACMRPSEIENISEGKTPISSSVLQDVNATMDGIRTAMSNSLQKDCERLGGYWVATQYNEYSEQSNPSGNNIKLFDRFYNETNANTKWGYCAEKAQADDYYGTTTADDYDGTITQNP